MVIVDVVIVDECCPAAREDGERIEYWKRVLTQRQYSFRRTLTPLRLKFRSAVLRLVRVRRCIHHWMEWTARRACAPGGFGRTMDQLAFEREFCEPASL